jgi:two-component system response regulator
MVNIMEQEIDILLIEDNPHEAELTIRSLRKHHLTDRLMHIDDGAEALRFLGSPSLRVPKLVLLDLKLPKVDGLEILRELKSNPRTRMIPVVVLTSSKEERDIVDSYKLGVNSYIVKPVNFESFVKAVSELGLYWLLMNQNVSNEK